MGLFFIDVVITLIAAYFVKREYDEGRIGWVLFWALLLGWDLHTLLVNL